MSDDNDDPVVRIAHAGERAYRNEMVTAKQEIERLRQDLKRQDNALATILKAAMTDSERSNELERYRGINDMNGRIITTLQAKVAELREAYTAQGDTVESLHQQLMDHASAAMDRDKRQRAIIDRMRPVLSNIYAELSNSWETEDQVRWRIDQVLIWVSTVLKETAE